MGASRPARPQSVRGGYRVVHRPRWPQPAAADGDDRVQEFVLTGELPVGHPMFDDGFGRFHDPQAAFTMVRRLGEGIGQSHFGVPGDRVGVFYRFGLDTCDVGAWRRLPGPGTLTVHLRIRPDKMIGGVPRSLEFDTRLAIDGADAGTGSASLLLLTPVLHRSHREHSRAAVHAAAEGAPHGGAGAPGAGTAPDPGEVGRAGKDNVLLHDPVELGGDRLSAAVRPAAGWPSGGAADADLPSSLALEALRQTALLAAHRLHGLDPRHSTPAALHTHFRGYAEPEVAMRCAAVAQPPRQDALGRRLLPLALTLTQAGRAVTEATISLVEDL
ncbi:AfsA-related hotdog domain-containing protein [Streptomyces fuscichromogenes]|uniref:AfsA-related hotdog domain-containing protein n=1 Tax=Streptomyces fuscichromogenes TaxID=1324013 RepID=UPI00381ECA73